MRKLSFFIIIYAVFVLVLSFSIYKTLSPNELGQTYSYLYESLDLYLNKIESNMNEITISNDEWDWVELKEINTEDEQLKNTYNLLISDIRTYYLSFSNSKSERNNNISLLNFKDKTRITDKELSDLSNNDNYLENFDKYNSMILSNDQTRAERIKAQINIIVDYDKEESAYKDFGQLLYDELVTTSKIASLSSWLKTEYYSNLE